MFISFKWLLSNFAETLVMVLMGRCGMFLKVRIFDSVLLETRDWRIVLSKGFVWFIVVKSLA